MTEETPSDALKRAREVRKAVADTLEKVRGIHIGDVDAPIDPDAGSESAPDARSDSSPESDLDSSAEANDEAHGDASLGMLAPESAPSPTGRRPRGGLRSDVAAVVDRARAAVEQTKRLLEQTRRTIGGDREHEDDGEEGEEPAAPEPAASEGEADAKSAEAAGAEERTA